MSTVSLQMNHKRHPLGKLLTQVSNKLLERAPHLLASTDLRNTDTPTFRLLATS